jgi:creatinine amidohydrolase/Fe(II)-dependent formamide hydrolase-like protein
LTDLATGLYQSMRKYGVSIPYYFEEYTRNGALGDATLATPEFGRELIESGLTNFCAFVEELLASPFAGGGRGAGGTR